MSSTSSSTGMPSTHLNLEQAIQQWNKAHPTQKISQSSAKAAGVGKKIFLEYNETRGFSFREVSDKTKVPEMELKGDAERQKRIWEALGDDALHLFLKCKESPHLSLEDLQPLYKIRSKDSRAINLLEHEVQQNLIAELQDRGFEVYDVPWACSFVRILEDPQYDYENYAKEDFSKERISLVRSHLKDHPDLWRKYYDRLKKLMIQANEVPPSVEEIDKGIELLKMRENLAKEIFNTVGGMPPEALELYLRVVTGEGLEMGVRMAIRGYSPDLMRMRRALKEYPDLWDKFYVKASELARKEGVEIPSVKELDEAIATEKAEKRDEKREKGKLA